MTQGGPDAGVGQRPELPRELPQRPKSNQNFIGVPPNMTESSRKSADCGEFVDEEEEEEA